jgi:hypothetical protein
MLRAHRAPARLDPTPPEAAQRPHRDRQPAEAATAGP